MGIKPITRKEMFMAAAAGESVATPTPVTREEYFLSKISGGGVGGGGITTLHINITDINEETMNPTFTADKTPMEMMQASANGPIWCVISFAAGLIGEEAVSYGVPPTWGGGSPTFGTSVSIMHQEDGNNKTYVVVTSRSPDKWILDLTTLV